MKKTILEIIAKKRAFFSKKLDQELDEKIKNPHRDNMGVGSYSGKVAICDDIINAINNLK